MKNIPLIIVVFSSGLDLQTVKRNINTCCITSVLTSKNPEQHGEVNIDYEEKKRKKAKKYEVVH